MDELLRAIVAGTAESLPILLPVCIIFAAVKYEEWWGRGIRSPQSEKLLRPAGYSLMLKLEDAASSFLFCLVVGTATFYFIGKAAALTGSFAGYRSQWTFLLFGGITFGLATLCTFTVLKSYRRFVEAQRLRLGVRGEQAVAEVLNDLFPLGYRAFHDLQPDRSWNIDHVIVGTRGVFVIETKARRKYPSRIHGQRAHEVIYDGSSLQFPTGRVESATVRQAQRNANWLADFLAKDTEEIINVQAVVVLPGWYVKEQGKSSVRVMNTKFLSMLLQNQPETISPAQVRRIWRALDRTCRNIEF